MSEQTGGHVGGKPKSRDEMPKWLSDAVVRMFAPADSVGAKHEAKIKDLESRLKVATDATQVLDEQYKAKKAEVEKLNVLAADRMGKIVQLRQQFDARGKEIDSLKGRLSEAEQNLEASRAMSEVRRVEILNLKEYVDSSAKQAAELQSRLFAAEALVQSNVRMRVEVAKELEQVRQDLEAERRRRDAVALGKFTISELIEELERRKVSADIRSKLTNPPSRGAFLDQCVTELESLYAQHGKKHGWSSGELAAMLGASMGAIQYALPRHDTDIRTLLTKLVAVCMRFCEERAPA